jgi:hypothetical protein
LLKLSSLYSTNEWGKQTLVSFTLLLLNTDFEIIPIALFYPSPSRSELLWNWYWYIFLVRYCFPPSPRLFLGSYDYKSWIFMAFPSKSGENDSREYFEVCIEVIRHVLSYIYCHPSSQLCDISLSPPPFKWIKNGSYSHLININVSSPKEKKNLLHTILFEMVRCVVWNNACHALLFFVHSKGMLRHRRNVRWWTTRGYTSASLLLTLTLTRPCSLLLFCCIALTLTPTLTTRPWFFSSFLFQRALATIQFNSVRLPSVNVSLPGPRWMTRVAIYVCI